VSALAKKLGYSESAISQHLKILRNAGLVKGDKRGYYTHYYVDRQILLNISDELSGMADMPADPRKCHERRC
jgi:DNA-binding transcriptional ArsR family regulator